MNVLKTAGYTLLPGTLTRSIYDSHAGKPSRQALVDAVAIDLGTHSMGVIAAYAGLEGLQQEHPLAAITGAAILAAVAKSRATLGAWRAPAKQQSRPVSLADTVNAA